MKIISTEFVQGVVDETAVLYDGTPHIAFIGRSNVGKSSTLNSITGKRKLVKVGQTPGKTKEINFFRNIIEVSEGERLSQYLVDLPGYGYAKVSKEKRNKLKKLIEWYVSHEAADIGLICLIIDAKVGLTDLDREMLELLLKHNRRIVVAVNKIDKLNQKILHKLRRELSEELKNITTVYYSAETKKHINLLQEATLYKKEG